jgi:hypothetical protein
MNYMAVADYLQQPLSNLQNSYNLTDFAFPFPFQSLTPPLTPIEQQYHTFITNAIYLDLPNFRAQIDTFIADEANKLIDGSTPMLGLYITIILLAGLAVVSHTLLVCRIIRCTNRSR